MLPKPSPRQDGVDDLAPGLVVYIDVGICLAASSTALPAPQCLVSSPTEGPPRDFLAGHSQRVWAGEQYAEPSYRADLIIHGFFAPLRFHMTFGPSWHTATAKHLRGI